MLRSNVALLSGVGSAAVDALPAVQAGLARLERGGDTAGEERSQGGGGDRLAQREHVVRSPQLGVGELVVVGPGQELETAGRQGGGGERQPGSDHSYSPE